MVECLIPWYEEITPINGIKSLLNYTGNYGMPYVTILWLLHFIPGQTHIKIKAVSILFEYVCAFAVGLLSSHFYNGRGKNIAFHIGFALTILYPVLIINGSWTGQCDGIYSAFVILMIYALLREKPALGSILLGCAFAFKFQTIFIIPFVILFLYRRRHFSLLNLLLVPITVEILYIPAIIAGYSPLSPITIYLSQADYYPQMYMYYPGLWCFFWRWGDYYAFSVPAICLVLTSCALIFIILLRRNRDISDETWVEIAFITTFLAVYFLPAMHERYGIISELLAIVYAIVNPRRIWVSISIWISITWTIIQPLFMGIWPEHTLAAAGLLVVLIALVLYLTHDLINDDQINIPNNSSYRFKFEKITRAETRFLEFADKKIYIAAIIIVFLAYIYSGRRLISTTTPDYLNDLMNSSGNHTPLYMLLINILNHVASIIGKNTYFMLRLTSLGACIASTLLWSYIVSHKNVLKTSYVMANLLLPTTLFYTLIGAGVDGVILFMSGLGLLLLKKSSGNKKSFITIMASGLSFGIAIALAPNWIIFVAGIAILYLIESKQSIRSNIISISSIALAFILFTGFMDSFKSLILCFSLNGAIIAPICSLLLILIYKNKKYLPVLLLTEYAALINIGKYMDVVEERLWIAAPIMICAAILITAVYSIQYRIYLRSSNND